MDRRRTFHIIIDNWCPGTICWCCIGGKEKEGIKSFELRAISRKPKASNITIAIAFQYDIINTHVIASYHESVYLTFVAETSKYHCDPSFWVDKYSDILFKFAVLRVSNNDIAEDLVQDTFLSGLNALKNFRGDCSEKSWLYNILRNKIIDHYRKKTNQELKMGTFPIESDEDTFYNQFFKSDRLSDNHWRDESAPLDWGISADNVLEKEEFMKILQLCLSILPELWSNVFSLKNIEEYSTDEICKELGITASNLWTIVHRAKLQLRGCLERKWVND